MSEEPKFPNANLYVLILAAEEVLGKNGLKTVLLQGGLDKLAGKYPPNNLDMEIPFSLYGQVEQAFEDFYGPRGSKAILARVGRALFRYVLHEQETLFGLAAIALKALPNNARQKLILSRFAAVSSENFNMPTELIEEGEGFIIRRTASPCQYRERDTQEGVCDHVSLGTLQEAVKWATGKDYKAEQTHCLNLGDPYDSFFISKTPSE
ncbi:MAG: hypothetical protein AAF629_02320 [Chloroflexota bacterium]